MIVNTQRPVTEFAPIATELLFGASVWVYRSGEVRVLPIEHHQPPEAQP